MTFVRFAPSPTGRLHVGNARIALVNWLFARKAGGRFLFRLDDTDTERSTAEFAEAIEVDLRWLGLAWDEFARESDRFARYDAAIERLRQAGRLYPAWETAEELELRRKLQVAQHRPPLYDRAALRLSEAEKERLTAERGAPHWRFRLDGRRVAWDDMVKGETVVDTASLSDPVLIRADGRPLYTLTSVVDDVDFAISHVIRGEDHMTNTGVQIELFEALGAPVPGFGHLSLLVDATGAGLSKRLGALSLESLREDGVEAIAVDALLARLGTADPVEPVADLATLVEGFDITRFGKAPARFDPAELKGLSARCLQMMPHDVVRDRLPAGMTADFWALIRANAADLAEAAAWWRIVTEGPASRPAIDDSLGVLPAAAALLPEGEPTRETWGLWTKAVAARTGAKGKALFLPLRLALTGKDHGPEMKSLLPFLPRCEIMSRIGTY